MTLWSSGVLALSTMYVQMRHLLVALAVLVVFVFAEDLMELRVGLVWVNGEGGTFNNDDAP